MHGVTMKIIVSVQRIGTASLRHCVIGDRHFEGEIWSYVQRSKFPIPTPWIFASLWIRKILYHVPSCQVCSRNGFAFVCASFVRTLLVFGTQWRKWQGEVRMMDWKGGCEPVDKPQQKSVSINPNHTFEHSTPRIQMRNISATPNCLVVEYSFSVR